MIAVGTFHRRIDSVELILVRQQVQIAAAVGERLAVRNMLDELRAGGQITGGPPNFGAKDKQAFANQLDRWLTKAGG